VRRGDAQTSYGELMQLAVQASSIAAGMAIPGLIGGYLDFRLGTQFCVLIGIGLGVVAGTVQLLALARQRAKTDLLKKQSLAKDESQRVEDEDPDRDAGT
jgi:opacity protein-like surface antigen